MAEGDADAIGDAYAEEELTESEREEYEQQSRDDAEESAASLDDVPPTLVAFFADRLREANPPHTQRKIKTNNKTGRLISRCCI